MRRLPIKLFDDGIDELGLIAHQGARLRVGVTLGMGGLATAMIPWFPVAVWLGVILAGELWAWIATLPQARGRTGSQSDRAHYAGSLWLVVNCWLTLGGMLWAMGGAEGAVAATVLWLSVIFFAQTYAYQSLSGLAIGGAWPLLVVPAIVIFAPNPLHLRLLPMLGILTLAFLFAGDGVLRMLTARKRYDQAQAELQARDAQYRVLADNVTDVIAMNTFSGRRVYISPSVTQAMGYTPEELFTTNNYTFLHPDDAGWVPRALAALVESGGKTTLQYRVLHKDGRPLWVETNFGLVEGDGAYGEPLVISVSRPIDARKALEKDLVEARQRAETAAAAKSDFLANMTHELRTPLNAIIGFSGVLRGSPRLAGDDARHVGLIHDASNTLLELVNSVLDYSKLEAGAAQLEVRPFDPVAPARAMAGLLAEQASAKGLDLAVVTQGEIAPLVGDATRIRQVLLNFLSNAIKFTAAGGVTVTVTQGPAQGDGDRLRMAVSDSGIGVTREQVDHLFDRFTQADASVSRQYGGTGLGLAICKRIVELMGGTLGCDSTPGEGATFWFELTLPRAEALPVEAEPAEAPALEAPLRLLLVEDVAVNRELIATLLAPFEVEIEACENGQLAVDAMVRGGFDLVLMDVQMPVMDGLTATRAIRALPHAHARTTPIIAMTANVLPEQVRKCLDAGMDDHIGKPISPASLLGALSRWSSGREAGAEDQRASA